MDNTLRDTLLEVIENSLEAQLRAVRRLRSSPPGSQLPPISSGKSGKESMSQIDMAYDILSTGQPLHINDILAAIRKRFKTEVDRESLVSAISKRVVRGDRFRRAGKNTFALLTPPS
jgi:hypothetical protein